MMGNQYLIKLFAILLMGYGVGLSAAYAQDSTQVLSLGQAISAALNNNKDIRLAMLDERIAVADYKRAGAVFMPQVDAAYSAMSTNNPLSAFGFKLQQRSITPNDFNPDVLNQPRATADYMAKLEVQQPLVNMDLLYQRKGAQKQTEVYQYKTQRAKEYLTFEVQKAYLQLQLAYSAEAVVQEALLTTQAVYTYTDNHYKQGLIQKSDVLNAQVQVAALSTSLAKAKSNIRNACDGLGLLMGRKPGVLYQLTEATMPEPQATLTAPPLRADFMAMQKAIEASGLAIKASQMSYLPKLNAFGNYQYNDSRPAGFGANAYLVGVQLSWHIFNGNRTQNTIAAQKLERDKLVTQLAAQKDESNLQISKAYRDLADALTEIEQDKTAVEQAAEALRILQNRYQQGLVATTDVLTAQTQLAQQKFLLAQAQFTANATRAYLQFLNTAAHN